jgi:eukaryotic-like serine/threonine-protein kinase
VGRDDWDEIYARPKPPGMHASTAFLIAFFTSVATSAGTVYVVERFDLLKKPAVQAAESVVPDLKGLSETDARANAQSSKIVLLVASREPSADAKPGAVVRQSIPAGQRVPQQHPVSVVLAEALPKIPAVTGLTLADATKKLEDLGYKVVPGAPVADPQAPAGQVLSQTPAAETAAEKGKSVALVVSAGPGDVVVPKLAGFALAKAKTEIEKLGLKPVVRWVSLAETATYVVLNQKPVPNEKVKPGAEVELVVNR